MYYCTAETKDGRGRRFGVGDGDDARRLTFHVALAPAAMTLGAQLSSMISRACTVLDWLEVETEEEVEAEVEERKRTWEDGKERGDW